VRQRQAAVHGQAAGVERLVAQKQRTIRPRDVEQIIHAPEALQRLFDERLPLFG